MIAGIANVRNEEDILDVTLRHLLAEGVDRLYLIDGASTDGTWGIIADVAAEHPGCVSAWMDASPVFHQAARINELASRAGADGADWVLPFDADEIFYASIGGTIAEALGGVATDIGVLRCRLWQHVDWHYREPGPLTHPKVVFRWDPAAELTVGQHLVMGVPGGTLGPLLEARHLQYRGSEHFIARVRDGTARWPADAVEQGYGIHVTELADLSDAELREEWQRRVKRATVYDPVPVRR